MVQVLPYSRKIWRELYLAKWPPSGQKLKLAFGLFGSLHVVHGRVPTRELCLRPSHTQEHMDSVVGIVLQCKIESGNIKDQSMPTPEAYSRCTFLAD